MKVAAAIAMIRMKTTMKKIPQMLCRKNLKIVTGQYYLRFQNTQIMKNHKHKHNCKTTWYNQTMQTRIQTSIKLHKKLRTQQTQPQQYKKKEISCAQMIIILEKRHSTSITQRCRNLQTYTHQKKAKHGSHN